jgi:hypothetical protein
LNHTLKPLGRPPKKGDIPHFCETP